MKKREIMADAKELLKEIDLKAQAALNKSVMKYIINYEIVDDHIKVISSTGDYRIVKNTSSNIKKINQAIVKNKVAIAARIDEYEDTYVERIVVLLMSLFLVSGSGVLIPFTFFIGNLFIFSLAVLLFSFSVIIVASRIIEYSLLVKNIKQLKKVTGYKRENEFELKNIIG